MMIEYSDVGTIKFLESCSYEDNQDSEVVVVKYIVMYLEITNFIQDCGSFCYKDNKIVELVEVVMRSLKIMM